MNQLNSIILEGTVKSVSNTTTPSSSVLELTIGVTRTYNNARGNKMTEESVFTVCTYGAMAEIQARKAEKGIEVRIVGRLKQERWNEQGRECSRVIIIAEHIEYRAFKKEAKDEK